MHIERFVYWMFQPVLRGLRRNRWLIRRIFGVKIPGGMAVQFDPTTVLLAYALREIAEREDGRVLELGIGQGRWSVCRSPSATAWNWRGSTARRSASTVRVALRHTTEFRGSFG